MKSPITQKTREVGNFRWCDFRHILQVFARWLSLALWLIWLCLEGLSYRSPNQKFFFFSLSPRPTKNKTPPFFPPPPNYIQGCKNWVAWEPGNRHIMSLLPPEVHTALSQLLRALSTPDNAVRSQAEDQLNNDWVQNRPDVLLMGLAEQLGGATDTIVSHPARPQGCF